MQMSPSPVTYPSQVPPLAHSSVLLPVHKEHPPGPPIPEQDPVSGVYGQRPAVQVP